MMRPMFPYYGSKWNIARYYPAPVGGAVVEPFAGGAGYSCFYDVSNAILIDKDPIISGLWSYLISATEAEVLALPEMPEVGDNVDNYDLPQEAKWLIGFWLNRGSASPKKARTAYSARSDKAQLNWGPKAKERIASQLSSIRGWSVVAGEYHEAPDIEATWFIDPPYGDKGRYYRIQFTDFVNLGPWCRSRDGLVIACEGKGADWLPFRGFGTFKTSKGMADEVVYISGDNGDLFERAA